MQRYFAKEKNDKKIVLYDSDIHHIKKVMRNQINDQIEVVYEETLYLCKITNLEPLEIDIVNIIDEDKELNINLTVAVSLVNEQKFDLILQKLTELGVSTIIPLRTERSIVRLDDKKEIKKIERWKTICKEASEQSHRTKIPTITNIMNIKELSKIDSDLKLICSLSENTKPLNKYLEKNLSKITFVIGPEGGFTKNEEEYLLTNSFLPVSLGKRVLRVETAVIYVASVINYTYEE